MLPHSHSNVTARYMSHTPPACTRQHAGHTHASTWNSLPGKLEERNTPAEGALSDRNWALNRTEYNTKPNSNWFHRFFFPFLAVSNASIQHRQQRERDYRQRCYEVQTKEMANHGKRKGTRMEKKKEQDERERRLISTLRSPSLTAPAQSFKTSSADGCRSDAASSSCLTYERT